MPEKDRSGLEQFYEKAGLNPKKLQRETDWSREYSTPNSRHYESKFLTDGLQLSADEFQGKWKAMGSGERQDFANAYGAKPDFTAHDEKIIDSLMVDGDDYIWSALAQFMLRDTRRDRIVTFFIARLNAGIEWPENYIQALGLAKAIEAVPAILPYYQRYRAGVQAQKTQGVPEDVIFGPIPYSSYIGCCETLWKITGSAEYKNNICEFLEHPHQQVRYWAEMALKND